MAISDAVGNFSKALKLAALKKWTMIMSMTISFLKKL